MMRIIVFIALIGMATPASAGLNVFACEPEWEALTREIAGDSVTVFSATTGLQDPHHIQARPSLMARMRRADLVFCTGADLESGWLPVLLRRAGRTQVQPGNIGYLEAASQVAMLDTPELVDRSLGDVHIAGNPHFHTDPRTLLKVAEALTGRLKILDPDNATAYENRSNDFLKRWRRAIDDWQKQASPLRGTPIIVQHNSWIYLSGWLGLREVATLEEKPGIPPTINHLAKVVDLAKSNKVKIIVRAAYQDDKSSRWLNERTNIPVVALPYTVTGNTNARDLFSLYDETVRLLIEAAGMKHGA